MLAELARDLLALGVGGTDGSLRLVHLFMLGTVRRRWAALRGANCLIEGGESAAAPAGPLRRKRAALVSQDDT